MSTANFIQDSQGRPITSVEEWFKFAPPQKEVQWQDFRSAKEFAKAWFRTGVPALPHELASMLEAHQATRGFHIERAIAEAQTPLDDFRGKTRHNDMLVIGHSATARTVVTIEAKADEPFGDLIGPYRKSKEGIPSKLPDRIAGLSRSIFGREPDALIDSLRYQLLHSFAAALIEAKIRGAAQAVFLVHEFRSSRLKPELVAENNRDLERFLAALIGSDQFQLQPGRLYGPFKVPGGGRVPADIPGYIGKAVTELAETISGPLDPSPGV